MSTTFNLRERQAPLKDRFTTDPESAQATMTVRSATDTGTNPTRVRIHTEAGNGVSWDVGAHELAAGDGDLPCSGDIFLASLAACQEITIRMVAAAMGIELTRLELTVEGDMDFPRHDGRRQGDAGRLPGDPGQRRDRRGRAGRPAGATRPTRGAVLRRLGHAEESAVGRDVDHHQSRDHLTMPLRVIFARHGESEANLAGIFANRREHAYDLTPAGIAQAEALARSLADLGVRHIYTSPLRRALQTATVIGGTFRVPVTETDGLREYDVGDYEGLPYTGEHAWRRDRYAAVEADWQRGARETRHPGGESLAELEERVVSLMDTIAIRHAGTETVLAVSHGGLLRVVLPLLVPDLTRDVAAPRPLDYTDCVIVERAGKQWRCIDWIAGSGT